MRWAYHVYMDADILQAIRIIDDKIASLQEARNRLANAFGIDTIPDLNPNHAPLNPRPYRHPASLPPPPPHAEDSQPSISGGRKVELAQFLWENGPMSRTAIAEGANIPIGTISYCLNDKRFFEQTEDGNWQITEFSKKGLESRRQTGKFEMET